MISFISPIPFTSRKPEIRKADDISRKTTDSFPIISSTKFRTFGDKFVYDKDNQENKAISRITNAIKEQREEIIDNQVRMFDLGYSSAISGVMPILKMVKKTRKGNCGEMAAATFGLLCANGYLNSRRATLYNKISFIDKKTGKCFFETDKSIDHGAVLTSMKKEDKFDAKTCNIAIDTWANIVDDKKNAVLKYKKLFGNKIKQLEQESLKELETEYCQQNPYDNRKPFNPNDYEMKSKLYFKIADSHFTDEDVKEFSDCFKSEFDF